MTTTRTRGGRAVLTGVEIGHGSASAGARHVDRTPARVATRVTARKAEAEAEAEYADRTEGSAAA
ncbi:hypothetical protein [Streptomyces sp. NPDC056144]|uniref:hypothetical protein n=1 Tax=unclassified Streptomyces TaxID=2593676 RepID=UPI0035D8B43E